MGEDEKGVERRLRRGMVVAFASGGEEAIFAAAAWSALAGSMPSEVGVNPEGKLLLEGLELELVELEPELELEGGAGLVAGAMTVTVATGDLTVTVAPASCEGAVGEDEEESGEVVGAAAAGVTAGIDLLTGSLGSLVMRRSPPTRFLGTGRAVWNGPGVGMDT